MTHPCPLRSVSVGDGDFYASEVLLGINQGMTMAGHWHSSVNIRCDIGTIAKRIKEVDPMVIWAHMLLWSPGSQGTSKTTDLLCLLADWRAKRGTKVFLHDGDARVETRFPTDISPAVDLALCNHTADRSAWKIPQLHWPYFAFYQREIAQPVPEYTCDLAFAGRLDGGPMYQPRTELVYALQDALGSRMKVFPGGDQHTLFRTPELAASAGAILGYGRPERNGWLDVRTFLHPGAGGVLLIDDTGGLLEPGVHYVPYQSGNRESVLDALAIAHEKGPAIRAAAFTFVQEHHSATARVRAALAAVGLTL